MAQSGVSRSAELTPLEWTRRVPPWAVDLTVGALLVLIGVLTTGSDPSGTSATKSRDAMAWALIGVATVPLFARRRSPVVVFFISSAAVLTMMLAGYDEGALPSAAVVALYTVGTSCRPRALAASAVVAVATLIVLSVADVPRFGAAEFVSTTSVYGAAVLLGRSTLERRRRIDAFAEEQAEAARNAAAAERLRIAQELHDIVAHSLGLIAIQAAVAARVFDDDPAEAKRSLEHIANASRSSLAEIRWLVSALRDPADACCFSPVPKLSDLAQLTSDAAAPGLSVILDLSGELADVPAGVGLAAYRVAQEAVTNAMRHAPDSRVEIHVDATDGTLRIEVTNSGGSRPARTNSGSNHTDGHGLIGMRERVGVYGGTLTAGAEPGGGFRVTATMTYDGEDM
ncbi:MAG: sensor histidine kinase [Microthrixaceae bacterium]|nr:sensor histidine kinase [Microthrixaceae bacterium]